MWVIAIASLSIALSLVIMGGISYFITEKAAIDKLKSKDLFYILESVSEKIEGRIARAKETSLLIAQDPFLNNWVAQGETDVVQGKMAEEKLKEIAEEYDYSSTFVVSNVTHNYWSEQGLIGSVSETNSNDDWFFQFINSNSPIEMNIDYNEQRDNTYVFVNAVMGSPQDPIGAAGIGLDLEDIAQELASYNMSEGGNLWLIDETGRIQLAGDLDSRGQQLSNYLPPTIYQQISSNIINNNLPPQVLDYPNTEGELYDIAYMSLQATDWQLILQIPRTETIGFLQSIKINTLIAAFISLLSIILVFYLVSTRIANPLKRAILLSQELDTKVEERTKELKEQNEKIMDSIDYAKKLQQTIIPTKVQLRELLKDSFVIWKPRDVVGGDFYWLNRKKDRLVVALGDCTGHGVPGALMTMAVVPILKHLVDELGHDDPGAMLKELNIRLKAALQKDENDITDDGLDLGVCVLKENTINFAGAKIDLYVRNSDKVEVVRGDRESIGYQRGDSGYEFKTISLDKEDVDCLYLTTDGFLDQNGGPKDYSYGKNRFTSLIEEVGYLPLFEQEKLFTQSFEEYKGTEPQRDDLAVLGFRINS